MSDHVLHLVSVDLDTDPPSREYRVDCPGVSDRCRAYESCGECSDTELDGLEADETAHGKFHAYVDGEWMVETGRCFVQTSDSLLDAADDLGLTEPGAYPVTFTVEDGVCLLLERAS